MIIMIQIIFSPVLAFVVDEVIRLSVYLSDMRMSDVKKEFKNEFFVVKKWIYAIPYVVFFNIVFYMREDSPVIIVVAAFLLFLSYVVWTIFDQMKMNFLKKS